MKSIIFSIILAVIAPTAAFAQQSTIDQANKAYSADKFADAISLYNKVIKEEGVSSELYYNLGNAHYRSGHMGEAILNYERALKLNPSNGDARTNLEFVKEKAGVTESSNGNYFTEKFNDFIINHSSNAWASLAASCFVLFIVALLIYLFIDNVTLRKIGFFGGITLFVVSIITLSFSFKAKSTEQKHNTAIIMLPSATLSTSPRTPKDKSEEAILLNEGYKVTIIDSVTNKTGENLEKWYDVKTDDTHRAWIKAEFIAII